MATFFELLFTSQNYDAFRRIIHNEIPDTFDAWSWEATKHDAKALASGHIVRRIEIDQDEFTRHCRARNAPSDANTLRSFIYEKGMRD